MSSPEVQKRWRLNNPDKVRESQERYKLKYPERRRESYRKWKEKNRDILIEKRKQKRLLDPVKARQTEKKYRSRPKGKYNSLRGGAKRRGIAFSLSFQEYIQIISKPCTYCGSEKNMSIDRVNNKLGYFTNNSTSCCPPCNYMKRDMTPIQFFSHIQKIFDYAKKKHEK